MNSIFSQSENMKKEYCCTIVRIGEVTPIEGSDFLATTIVNGLQIVVRKEEVHTGDVLFYVANECQINHDFCRKNNLFEDKEMNDNKEVKGYINKLGRIRIIKLRGQSSMGFLFNVEDLNRWMDLGLKVEDLEIDTDFDTVNGELFVKAYVPFVRTPQERTSRDAKRNKKLARFDRMIPGEFSFHYDTGQLNREIGQFKPDDNVSISVKIHGTSLCLGNVKVNAPKWEGFYQKIFLYLPKFLQFTSQKYDYIYSSRTVIKNQYINAKVTDGFYRENVWEKYYNLFKNNNALPEGFTIYGEIFGYTQNGKCIQKDYDYGCEPYTNKLMIYRISQELEDGTHYEWNVQDVHDWTVKIMNDYPELAPHIHPIDILYNGTMMNLYPSLDLMNHWHENILELMKKEKRFGMEKNEPLCVNKVPREGIVIRKNNDPVKEAFKLKCLSFLGKEAELMDKGEVDSEMMEGYVTEEA